VTGAAPRVLVVTNMYPQPDDPARGAFVEAQVEALEAARVPVEVFQIVGGKSSRKYWAAIPPLRRTVRTWRADLVYAFYGLTGWVASWQSVPLVLSLAGDDILGSPNTRGGLTYRSRVFIGLSQWAALRSAAVCVQSDEMRARLWTRALRLRAHVVPYGVDARRFSPGDRTEARRRLGLPLSNPIVIFPNTPTEIRKRIDRAQQAMALVNRDIPDAILRVVSGVSHAAMPDYYRAADCCLLTSDWEGSPNVVKEALLSGLPVVTTDVGDVRRWIPLSPESAICAFDAASLAAQVVRTLREQRRVDPAPFLEYFSSSVIVSQMLELFRSVLAERGNPR
jgi:glycosyltransferase involved in cell wall biosynthesis